MKGNSIKLPQQNEVEQQHQLQTPSPIKIQTRTHFGHTPTHLYNKILNPDIPNTINIRNPNIHATISTKTQNKIQHNLVKQKLEPYIDTT
jgi:transcriptional regulator